MTCARLSGGAHLARPPVPSRTMGVERDALAYAWTRDCSALRRAGPRRYAWPLVRLCSLERNAPPSSVDARLLAARRGPGLARPQWKTSMVLAFVFRTWPDFPIARIPASGGAARRHTYTRAAARWRLTHIPGVTERVAAGLRPDRQPMRFLAYWNNLDFTRCCVDGVDDIVVAS